MVHKTTNHTPAVRSGSLPYNMTNDYMFRAVLQENKMVLKGLIGALLHLAPESLEVEITNPITLGKSFNNKDIILDIHVIINGKTRLNLEMQITNYHNWKERSLTYLCRSFDNIRKGDDYAKAVPVIHIGFLNFDLFPENPEFYATYMFKNVKNDTVYTDKMQLSVIELNHTELATEEDRRYEIDKWVNFFKARTWKELNDMAATNQYMSAAADTIYELSSDENIRELCRRRADYEAEERRNAENAALIIKQSNELAKSRDKIARQEAEIARLRALLGQSTDAER